MCSQKDALFSRRSNLGCPKDLQLSSVDKNLRTALWNAAYKGYFSTVQYGEMMFGYVEHSNRYRMLADVWDRLCKLPVNKMPDLFSQVMDKLEDWVLNKAEWFEVYDFIELAVRVGPREYTKAFVSLCNQALERESAGYRLVSGRITPILAQEEIGAIEDAIGKCAPDPLIPVKRQLENALHLMSDREHPDYRNSIKESISAVEGLMRIVSGNTKADFYEAIELVEKKIGKLHGALKDSFKKLYGYTSDSKDGIRHAMLQESNLTLADARFMLIVCSAFINYVIANASDFDIDTSNK